MLVNAPGLANVVNGTLGQGVSLTGDGEETCVWGWPVLDPAPRLTDDWGIGWVKLHEIEVMEVDTADVTEVHTSCWPKTSASESSGQPAGRSVRASQIMLFAC